MPGEKGKIVKGEKLCCSAVFRSQPGGSDIELLARGVHNPYGLAFSEEGGSTHPIMISKRRGFRRDG